MRLVLALLLSLFVTAAFAQTAPLQSGPWTPGHVSMYGASGFSQPILQDAGAAQGGDFNATASEMALTVRGTGKPPYASAGSGPNGENFCDYDGPTTSTAGYHVLCISANAAGGGLISFGAYGGAASLPFYFNVNGAQFSPIEGPLTTVNGHVACWGDNAGATLTDCGISGTVTSVGLTAPSEFSVAGSPVTTSGSLALSWANPVSIAHGGSGQITANAALNAFLPAQTSQTGKVLSTDGNNTSWVAAAGGGTVTSVGMSTPTEFSVAGTPITAAGTITLSWANPVGVSHGGTGLTSGTSGGIPYYSGSGTIGSSAALTANQIVIGGGAGTTPATLGSLGTSTTVLHGNASGPPSFGAVALGTDVSGTLPTANGGTGAANLNGLVQAGTTNTLTVGYTVTPFNIGTVSSGTTTLSGANGNYQYLTNNGAFTLAAPTSDTAITLLITNGASAGTITPSGFTVSSNTGDPFTTTNTNKFLFSVIRINGTSTYLVKALQ